MRLEEGIYRSSQSRLRVGCSSNVGLSKSRNFTEESKFYCHVNISGDASAPRSERQESSEQPLHPVQRAE